MYISADVPSALNWKVDVEPKKIILLCPKEKADFKVNVYVPTIVSAKDYSINVRAISVT